MSRRTAYIAHPLNAPTPEGITANLQRAARWVTWAARQGVAPSATWIVLASQWDESWRELGLEIDKALVARCDEVWLVGGRVSAGMQVEAEQARSLGIPVLDLTHLGEEPPQ